MGSGYDLSSKVPFRLMKGRLGVYDKKEFNSEIHSIEGIIDQSSRMKQHGGNRQQERMIQDKRRSLNHAVWNSYQGAEVVREDAEDRTPVRALINPNKLKQDYDDKIISVGFEYNFKCGDVFEWVGTKTHWLIYLQDMTELAYFGGDIRKCSYEIAWKDEDGQEHKTYAATKGPVETRINYIQKYGISVDTPNLSLNILMPKNENTLKYFQRYGKFYLQGDDTCWRVEALDWISTPGILEVIAVEYYANEIEDDVGAGVVKGLVEDLKDPNGDENAEIIGNTFIKVKTDNKFKFNGSLAAEWSVDKKYPVKLTIDPTDPRNICVKWDSPYSGQFELFYGNYKKLIVVESLF